MERVAAELGSYLMGRRPYPEEIAQHVFFSGPTGQGQFSGLNTYLTMANDLQLVGTEDRLYFYAILSGIVIVSPLRLPADCGDLWRGGTLLLPGETIHAHDQTIADAQFGGILASFAATLRDGKAAISPRQRARLDEELRRIDKPKFARSRHGQALAQDFLNEQAIRDNED
jgi:hypothetical protein